MEVVYRVMLLHTDRIVSNHLDHHQITYSPLMLAFASQLYRPDFLEIASHRVSEQGSRVAGGIDGKGGKGKK